MAKKVVKKKAVAISSLTMLAAQANIPWEQAAKGIHIAQGASGWEEAVAAEHARLSHLWAEAMIEEGKK